MPNRLWRVVCFNCKERGHFRRDCPLDKGNTATENKPEAAICEEGRPLRCRHYAQIKRECSHCPNCPAAVLFDPDSDDEGKTRQQRAHVKKDAPSTCTERTTTRAPQSPSRAARKGPPRHARFRGVYVP